MLTIAGIAFSDADLWALKQALGNASAPSPTPAPTTQPTPVPPAPTGGRNVLIRLEWGAPKSGNVRVFTRDYGGFRGTDVAIVSFTTPAVIAPGQVGALQAAEFGSPAVARTAALSTRPGSFDNDLGAKGFFGSVSGAAVVTANTASVSFQVGGTSSWSPVLQPSTTYYFNIRNTAGSGGDLVIELVKPPGL